MKMKKRVAELIADFADRDGWEARYKHIIDLGKNLPPMKNQYRIDANKVKGCQSQVWLYGELVEDGKVLFSADSDASIVKGIIALLLRIYSDAKPEEILATSPDFLATIGLQQHLSMSRANGLNAMVKQISLYALAYKRKLEMAE